MSAIDEAFMPTSHDLDESKRSDNLSPAAIPLKLADTLQLQ
jgi:hypothetical protein